MKKNEIIVEFVREKYTFILMILELEIKSRLKEEKISIGINEILFQQMENGGKSIPLTYLPSQNGE